MRIRVIYPLEKPLQPELKVKIRGRGVMPIMLRYENVPYFCFSCRMMGHAAANCEMGDAENQGICFGEELRASPPRRARDILVHALAPQVARPLFQLVTPGANSSYDSQGSRNRTWVQGVREDQSDGHSDRSREEVLEKSVPKVDLNLADGVKELNVSGKVGDSTTVEPGKENIKERVSFGTNMSTEDDTSTTESMFEDSKRLDTLVWKMQTRKTAIAQENAKAKYTSLKVQSSNKKKKHKTHVKTSLVDMQESMKEDGLEARSSKGNADN
jgi:hypothetical protein